MKKSKAQTKKKYVLLRVLFIMAITVLAGNVYGIPVYATTTQSTTSSNGNGSEAQGTSNTTSDNGDSTKENGGFSLTYDSGSGTGELSGSVQILLVLTIISLAPSILIMLTSFTRIIIVLHFTRAALNTQTAPPNQVLIGLALFLTVFIMSPVFHQINEDAIQPYNKGEISQEVAIEKGMEPLREFMYGQTKRKDVQLFMDISGEIDKVENPNEFTEDDIPTYVLVPSFIISELRTAFIIGFLIYIPFIVIDMVVASVLMSMGMMMLPPTTISMPFKILLFVLADGWSLVIGNLVKTFY